LRSAEAAASIALGKLWPGPHTTLKINRTDDAAGKDDEKALLSWIIWLWKDWVRPLLEPVIQTSCTSPPQGSRT